MSNKGCHKELGYGVIEKIQVFSPYIDCFLIKKQKRTKATKSNLFMQIVHHRQFLLHINIHNWILINYIGVWYTIWIFKFNLLFI